MPVYSTLAGAAMDPAGAAYTPPGLNPSFGPDLGAAFSAIVALEKERAAYADQQKKKKKKGRAATVLTGPEGAGTPMTAVKTLLGE